MFVLKNENESKLNGGKIIRNINFVKFWENFIIENEKYLFKTNKEVTKFVAAVYETNTILTAINETQRNEISIPSIER